MLFKEIKKSIIKLLGEAAEDRFKVIGYQDAGASANEIDSDDRLVQVFYQAGRFPKSASGRGPFAHDMQFRIELTTSAFASVDLTVLTNPASTSYEIAAALAALEPAAYRADVLLDDLLANVYSILMCGDNLNLGCNYNVANRWVDNFDKTDIMPRGEYAVISGSMFLSARINEPVPTTYLRDLERVDVDVLNKDDDNINAGMTTKY
jgi:hypothetical protein